MSVMSSGCHSAKVLSTTVGNSIVAMVTDLWHHLTYNLRGAWHTGLAKTILQGTVKGKRKRGRQKKRWEDNIKERTGMDFASSTRAAENRSRWNGIVANSSVVPRRPSKVMG